jgi:hypothetical protein
LDADPAACAVYSPGQLEIFADGVDPEPAHFVQDRAGKGPDVTGNHGLTAQHGQYATHQTRTDMTDHGEKTGLPTV